MKKNQEKAQERYMQLQQLEQQAAQIQKQMQQIEQQAMELDMIAESLGEFKDIKEGTEILIPLANGIFAKASLKESKNLIVNVGSATAIPKPIDDVRSMILEQATELRKIQEDVAMQMQQVIMQASSIEVEMQKLIEEGMD